MLEPLSVGDYVFVHRNIEDTGLPGDVVERVGQVAETTPHGVRLFFPNGWTTDRKRLSRDLLDVKYETRGKPYTLKRVTLLGEQYQSGPSGGRMVPPGDIVEANRARFDGTRDGRLKRWPTMWNDINQHGLRHPPVVDEQLRINAGMMRVWAHHKAGADSVECFIVDISAKDL